ncbi:MAG: hypothetical protein UT37_C0010G0016 [Parcubacteria group bacterium GW2011_GWA2_39_18]|nr:MAG: hypothetical protein UT37_C0010G0016 [Parcubacteria group bacterium GW2011_GWA2_39_18]
MHKNILKKISALKLCVDVNSQDGITSLITIIVILSISALVVGSFSLNAANNISSQKNTLKSFGSYYASESGLEDAVLRIRKGLALPQPTPQPIGDSSVTVNISSLGSSTKMVTAVSAYGDIYRSTQTTTILTDGKAGFNYGAQVGEGGLTMRNGSAISPGNVFSNGSINGSPNKPLIAGDVLVAGNNLIQSMIISGNATAYSFGDCTIIQKRTNVTGGTVDDCPAGSTSSIATPLDPIPLPVDDGLLNAWKSSAQAGGIINGNVTLSGIQSYGPKKIIGNLTIDNGSTITLNGTVWITGNVTISNNATIKLNTSYGTKSDVLMADGRFITDPGIILQGSGNPSSFLMILSLSDSQDEDGPAIDVKNNLTGAIVYAANGLVVINNGVIVKEVTAYKLLMKENATLNYSSGLASTQFNMGSSAGWSISGWQEIP